MRYTWDPAKDASNRAKHGLSLADGIPVLQLPPVFRLTEFDLDHNHEDRWFTIGLVERGVLFVVHAEEHGDEVRIISVRRATATERHGYFAALEASHD